MSGTGLHEIVAERLELNWDRFRQAHPKLAAAVERAELVEVSVDALREDPAYQRAMAQAGFDEATLAGALEVLGVIDGVVGRVLGL